jgi:ectoine hydroxylase-related dioxygenase (phytanoyl-CoA dioxygenase family)
MHVKRTYDQTRYPFSEEIAKIFEVRSSELPLLHQKRQDLMPSGPLTFSTESRTKFHELVIQQAVKTESMVREVYCNFIRDIVAALFEGEFAYQTFPTFRLQLPGEMAIHQWHYDSDPNHRHPEWEINFQIPLTDMHGSRATWIESVPGLRDFSPMEMTVGQFAIFDGGRCLHGNKQNQTELSRLSLDFRILPWDRYVDQDATQVSISSGRRFVVGEYYQRFSC